MYEGLGIPLPMTAGAIVSGAFFGDKLSPMSDSTNLTPSVLGVNLYAHIRHMLYTTLPALGISLLAFTLIGFWAATNNQGSNDISLYKEFIQENFNLSIWLFIPPLVVIFLIIRKIPAIPSLLAGLILGSVAFIVIQGGSFTALFESIHHGFQMSTGKDEMDALFTRGGMASMYEVVALALVSLTLGGIMNKTGMLHSMVLALRRFTDTAGNLTATVLGTSFLVNVFGANQYLAVILPGQMYEECYRNQKLKLKNLTRTLEAGGTLTSPLIPWNSSGVFVYTTIGVSVFSYAPYAILCWLTPIIALLFGYLKIAMHKLEPGENAESEDAQ